MELAERLKLIAKNIKKALVDKNMNQQELATLTGMSEGCISRYLKCERKINIGALIKIAQVLEVTVDSLLGLDEDQ